MKQLYLLAVLLCAVPTAQAQLRQQDFVVHINGDTLRGQIRLAGPHNSTVKLYRSGMAPAEFNAAQALSYGSAASPIAVSKVVEQGGKPQFLVPLLTGYVSLYTGENAQGEKTYYLQAPDASYVTQVPRASNQLALARVLAGCPTLEFGLDETQRRYPYTTDGMIGLVTAYNSCRQPTQPSLLVKRAGGWHPSFGLKAGVNQSIFDVAAQAYAGFGSHRGASGYQAGVTFNAARLGHFSGQVEATYLTLRSSYGPYESYYSGIGNPSNTRTLFIKFSQLQIPVLLRYEVGYGRWRPYVNAGSSVGFNFSNASVATSPATTTGVITEPIELGKTSLGVCAGGGISLHAAAFPVLSLEVRYDRSYENSAHTQYLYHLSRRTALRFDMGIAF